MGVAPQALHGPLCPTSPQASAGLHLCSFSSNRGWQYIMKLGRHLLYMPTWMFAFSLAVLEKFKWKSFPVSPGPHRSQIWDQRGLAWDININKMDGFIRIPLSRWQTYTARMKSSPRKSSQFLCLSAFSSLNANPTFPHDSRNIWIPF